MGEGAPGQPLLLTLRQRLERRRLADQGRDAAEAEEEATKLALVSPAVRCFPSLGAVVVRCVRI